MTDLYAQLCRYESRDWHEAVERLSAEIHPVDRTATKVWFAFFPLDLHLTLEHAADPAATARRMGLTGIWRLADQVSSSHRFLYAHRYWPQVKSAVQSASPTSDQLAATISHVAEAASRTARVDREMLLGISAVALMTLRQAGIEAFTQAAPTVHLSEKARVISAVQLMRRRSKDDSQGWFGFTRGIGKRWTVTFDEADPEATFAVIDGQEIASGAQGDKRDYHSKDKRCTPSEGPIPVECRAASCGSCWVGVLAGAEKLSAVVDRDERRRMQVFGYLDSADPQPLIRLACQAKAYGAVSLVIPPWNGVFASCLARV